MFTLSYKNEIEIFLLISRICRVCLTWYRQIGLNVFRGWKDLLHNGILYFVFRVQVIVRNCCPKLKFTFLGLKG